MSTKLRNQVNTGAVLHTYPRSSRLRHESTDTLFSHMFRLFTMDLSMVKHPLRTSSPPNMAQDMHGYQLLRFEIFHTFLCHET